MKQLYYAYKKTDAGFFEPLIKVDIDKESVFEALCQSLSYSKKEELENMLNKDFYLVCEFDNLTGTVLPCLEFLGSLDTQIKMLLKKYEVIEDGKEA